MKRWRTWLGRIAFGLSVLALLGTSLPKWEMAGQIEGPLEAPDEEHTVRITIEASHEPRYTYGGYWYLNFDERQCTAAWTREKPKVQCLVPVGAKVKSVGIGDKCQSGGCCKSEPCKPPPGAFVKTTTDIVPIWKWIVEKEVTLHIGRTVSKDGGRTVVQTLEVGLENALPDMMVSVRAKEKELKERVAGWDGKEMAVQCRPIHADGGAPVECTSYFFQNESDKTFDIDVIVKAMVYGMCNARDGGTCMPPPEAKAVRIAGAAMKSY